jgi:hypothetical protein
MSAPVSDNDPPPLLDKKPKYAESKLSTVRDCGESKHSALSTIVVS